jgi:hypothetical protein
MGPPHRGCGGRGGRWRWLSLPTSPSTLACGTRRSELQLGGVAGGRSVHDAAHVEAFHVGVDDEAGCRRGPSRRRCARTEAESALSAPEMNTLEPLARRCVPDGARADGVRGCRRNR